MSLEIKGRRNKKKHEHPSVLFKPADSSVTPPSYLATKSPRRINGGGFARDTAQEETIAHGNQGQGHGSLAAMAKSGGKVNEEKREKMEGSTVAPIKNGGWDRDVVYECDDLIVACSYSIKRVWH